MLIALSAIIFALLVFLIYASASIRSGVYVKATCKLQTNEKLLALTFDDGPDARITPQLLDVLSKYNIQAVFFCIGSKIKDNEPILNRMVNEGHLIGNHSYTHSARFPLLSLSQMIEDVKRCEAEIARINGHGNLSFFRPPFGVTNPTIRKMVKQLNYRVMGWNLRSYDTTIQNHHTVIKHVTRKIKPGNILLFHDNLEHCPDIVEAVIEYALAQGYRFVRADRFI